MHTDDVSTEESIDPTHDERVRDNHRHVILHHAHHAVHLTWVSKRVRGRLTLTLRLLEESTGFVASAEVLAALLKRLLRQRVIIATQGNTAGESSLFAHGLGIELLRGRVHQDRGVVAQDTGQDHDDGDGNENPVAATLLAGRLEIVYMLIAR